MPPNHSRESHARSDLRELERVGREDCGRVVPRLCSMGGFEMCPQDTKERSGHSQSLAL